MKKGAGWAAAAALVVLPASCGPGSDADGPGRSDRPEKNTVILSDISFEPGTLTVDEGDTVTWRFEDPGISHDVVAVDESFKSEVQDSGTFLHAFDAPGTYAYLCSLHPTDMKGTVIVR